MAYRGHRPDVYRPSKAFLRKHGGQFYCPCCLTDRLGVYGLLIHRRHQLAPLIVPVCKSCWKTALAPHGMPAIGAFNGHVWRVLNGRRS